MKKKLKTIFSPRNLIVWLLIIILLIAIPELTRPSMSQTEALVSMLCVEKSGENVEVAVTVLTPGEERKVNNQVYTGSGKTLGEAVGNISIMLGKEMGFAQCEVVAFGDNICSDGVISSIDYMTRTKRVGRSAILINFSGEAKDFADAVNAYKPFVAQSDIIKFSDDELKDYTGKEDIIEGIESIYKKDTLIVITLGSKGSMYYLNGKYNSVETEKVKPIDTTGAGDAFFGTFLANIENKEWTEENIKNALKKANKAGAETTQFLGAIKL